MQTVPYIRNYVSSLMVGVACFPAGADLRFVKTAFGGLDFVCGGNSVVFRAEDPEGRGVAVKCYRDHQPRRAEVYALLREADVAPWGMLGEFYAEGLTLFQGENTLAVDVLVTPWIEGVPLDRRVTELRIEGRTEELCALCDEFDSLASWLLSQRWAHGDLKPDNILVSDNGLQLIDFDAAFVPAMTTPRSELGTAGYNHPQRTLAMDSKSVDDWALARIALALHALTADAGVRVADLFPWRDECFVRGSESFESMCAMFARVGDARGLRLCELLCGAFPELESLAEIFIQRTESPTSECTTYRGRYGWGLQTSEGVVVEPPLWDDIVRKNGAYFGLLRGVARRLAPTK